MYAGAASGTVRVVAEVELTAAQRLQAAREVQCVAAAELIAVWGRGALVPQVVCTLAGVSLSAVQAARTVLGVLVIHGAAQKCALAVETQRALDTPFLFCGDVT